MNDVLIGVFAAVGYTIFWMFLYVVWRKSHVKRESIMDRIIDVLRIVVLFGGFMMLNQSRHGLVAALTFLVFGLVLTLTIRAILRRVDPLGDAHDATPTRSH